MARWDYSGIGVVRRFGWQGRWWVDGAIVCPCDSTHESDAGEYNCGYVGGGVGWGLHSCGYVSEGVQWCAHDKGAVSAWPSICHATCIGTTAVLMNTLHYEYLMILNTLCIHINREYHNICTPAHNQTHNMHRTKHTTQPNTQHNQTHRIFHLGDTITSSSWMASGWWI